MIFLISKMGINQNQMIGNEAENSSWGFSNEKRVNLSRQTLEEVKPDHLRLQVLYSSISSGDITLSKKSHSQGYFGTEIIGKVVKLGKGTGSRKIGEIVGVKFSQQTPKQFHSGFTQFIDVESADTIFLPKSLPLEQSACLLTSGLIAYNALEKNSRKGDRVAIVGSGNLAYLAVQFAQKAFGLQVTLFGSSPAIAAEFGAKNFEQNSLESYYPNGCKFDLVIITEQLKEGTFEPIFGMVMKGGKACLANEQTGELVMSVFDLVVNQKEFIGAKRGNKAQIINMLHTAAIHNITGKAKVFEFKDFEKAFEAGADSREHHSIVVKVA